MKKNTNYILISLFIVMSFILVNNNAYAQLLNNDDEIVYNSNKNFNKKIKKLQNQKIRKALLEENYQEWKNLIKQYYPHNHKILNIIDNEKKFKQLSKNILKKESETFFHKYIKKRMKKAFDTNNYKIIKELEKKHNLKFIHNKKEFKKLKEYYQLHQKLYKIEKQF